MDGIREWEYRGFRVEQLDRGSYWVNPLSPLAWRVYAHNNELSSDGMGMGFNSTDAITVRDEIDRWYATLTPRESDA